jgi:hypothetical protein
MLQYEQLWTAYEVKFVIIHLHQKSYKGVLEEQKNSVNSEMYTKLPV